MARAANDSTTNSLTKAFHSSRSRNHSTAATTYGRMKNDMYTELMTISHHGGIGCLRRSCSHTVGTVPKNSHRSASTCHCHNVGRPSRVAAPLLRS
jgi:hypothetical protein